MKEKIQSTKFDVFCDYNNCFISPDGKITKIINNDNFELTASLIIMENYLFFDEKHSKLLKSEFLIISGFIMIKDSKAFYYVNKEIKPSEQQCNIISCVLYNNILVDKNSNIGKKIIKQNFINKYNFNQKYYNMKYPIDKEKSNKIFNKILNKNI